jgi:hypothetical protein
MEYCPRCLADDNEYIDMTVNIYSQDNAIFLPTQRYWYWYYYCSRCDYKGTHHHFRTQYLARGYSSDFDPQPPEE